jgi:hypothetical protein
VRLYAGVVRLSDHGRDILRRLAFYVAAAFVRLAFTRFDFGFVRRQFANVMPLTGAAKNYSTGHDNKTGSANGISHAQAH